MSLVDAEEVPLARSAFSASSTDSPRPAASRAMPHPWIPPPMMAMSYIPRLAHMWWIGAGRIASRQCSDWRRNAIVRTSKRRLSRYFEGSSLGRDLDRNVVVAADVVEARGRRRVGDEVVELRDMADAHRRRALVFHAVGHQDRPARAVHDGLGNLDLAVVEVEQRAVLVDGRGADDRIVDLELADEVDRRLADNAPVRMPHDAARDDHLDLVVSLQYIDNIYVIRDRQQPLLAAQGHRHLLGGGTDVDQDRRVVGDQRCSPHADPALLFGGETAPRLVADVGNPGGEDSAAMIALQHPTLAQIVEVLANGLGGDAEAVGQGRDAAAALRLGNRDDVRLAGGEHVHSWPQCRFSRL